MMKSFNNQ